MKPGNQDMPEATREMRVGLPTDKTLANKPTVKLGPWYLLTGLILGLILGLVYAWLVDPVIYENTEPASLKASFKESYRIIIAQTFEKTGDLQRAADRLALLEDPDSVYALGAQAQQALANGQPEEAHALALLASALQGPAEIEPVPIPTRTLPINTPTP